MWRRFGVIRHIGQKHPDAAHATALLRPHRKRPSGRCAAKKR
jgi:hypothetical protein